jgi:hypothetical protein
MDGMNGTLRKGDAVPHFDVRRLDGGSTRYASIWQHKDLVLVTLPEDGGGGEYASTLAARMGRFDGHPADCVITRDTVPGAPAPGALVADRWGEIFFMATAADVGGLPSPDELVEWLRFVQVKCPECEGESR